ncbi:MAG: hypothetical protein AB8B87_07260 [Granulosicoccus sp.]
MNQRSESAWNPGLQSDIPQPLWSLVTLFREENATVSYAEASELADLTGLGILELVCFRPERLVTHALLVRVTADLTVPDGPSYEELGINLRSMVDTLQSRHMSAIMPAIEQALIDERDRALKLVSDLLAEGFQSQAAEVENSDSRGSIFARWFGKSPTPTKPVATPQEIEMSALSRWRTQAETCDVPLERACIDALVKCVDSIIGHRGRMLPDYELVTRIVVNQVINSHGYTIVDSMIDNVWSQAVASEGYRPLPVQSKPVIMNVKGASASGKSTIRPQQRRLAQKLGIPWEDFALISPDYWRKYLLDYASLGDDYKYGAMLTGRELEMIDKKLDRYMADKADKGTMSHLLIDRFRFDSFTVNIDRTADSRLLSRFGDRVYLFFMVTHPAETVLRAWNRGRKTGRYKAVDDLLFHNVEAFTGMPSLFLSWVNSKDKRIHFEFLDNDVPEGSLPRTAAFGWNNTLIVLDISLLLNIDRYRKVNIAALAPEDIFKSEDILDSNNTGFITECARTVDCMVFADQETMTEYAVSRSGKLVWWDHDYILQHAESQFLVGALNVLGYSSEPCVALKEDYFSALDVESEKRLMVGHWSAR